MAPPAGLSLTELLASLSLATDLGTGQPLGHGLATCLRAVALAQELGCGPEEVRWTQQVALLRFLGCTSDAGETAVLAGGDDLAFNAAMAPVFMGASAERFGRALGAVGSGEHWPKRVRLLSSMFTDAGSVAHALAAHCEVASMLAVRLRLDGRVVRALAHGFERWDGKGFPAGLEGDAIPLETRIAVVARDADLAARTGEDVAALLARRRGRAYDPKVVDAAARIAPAVGGEEWEEVLAAEPQPVSRIEDLDEALTVMADVVDLKSRWTRGHSTRVAALAEAAALAAGLSGDDIRQVRRSGLVHDIGRVGVENGVWDKAGPLSTVEWEKVRLHPYLTERVLARCAELAPIAATASSHHERNDGSGYHRQVLAASLPLGTRLLAVADEMVALTSERPHRAAVPIDRAISELDNDVDRGRLDRHAVACVASAVAGSTSPRSVNPDGLTDRELEVLRLVANGRTNREVGESLFISSQTVGRHVENIYLKIGVSTRAGAAVYAMQNRLLS